MKPYIKKLIEVKNKIVLLFVIISIFIMSIETFNINDKNIITIIFITNILINIIFISDYIVNILLYRNNIRKYVLSFNGIIDLLSIIPIMIPSLSYMRTMRTIRLLRIIKLFKNTKLNNTITLFKNTLKDSKDELIMFGFMMGILTYISSYVIYCVENPVQPDAYKNIFDSFWWSIITLTSIGYGDIFPITVIGKLFTIVLALISMGIVAGPTAIISNALRVSINKNN